jgi:hypothetical protein
MLVAALGHAPFTVIANASAHRADGGDDGGTFLRAFKLHDGRRLVVVWSKDDGETVDVVVPGGASRATERRLDGGSVPYTAVDSHGLHDVALAPRAVRIFELAR